MWKLWGNVPYFEADLAAPYMAKQYTADEIYAKIITDLDFAITGDKLPMRTTAANDGRITKAAAQMLKARVVMYQKDAAKYAEVLKDMTEIIKSNKYSLVTDFSSIWLNAGEFGSESILNQPIARRKNMVVRLGWIWN